MDKNSFVIQGSGVMPLDLIGPRPFEKDAQGQLLTRIGTLFPDYNALITESPAIHACQRLSFVERLNGERAKHGLASLSLEEEQKLSLRSVDLIFEEDHILIRPNADQMDLAFAADELLQTIISKRRVRFLSVSDPRVREAIKKRGEYWRLSTIPKSYDEKQRLVFSSKVAIGKLPIYFYNRLTGTRWLTFEAFCELEALDDHALAAQLAEISEHSMRRNRMGRPELDFFAADLARFDARALAATDYEQLNHDELRAKFADLKERFASAAHEAYRKDDCHNRAWAERMLSTLFLEGNETQTEQILSGLSPEFYLQIEWLPGGRFEEGEFLFDAIFDEAANHPEDAALQRLCDPRAKGVIFNLIRDYGDLDYINVGTVPESLSLKRPDKRRRGVFIAELQSRSEERPIKRFARLQKWGVWDHLDEGKNLLQAIQESDEYTDYWQDRRLGCRQLGMKLTRRVIMRRLSEIYKGKNERYRGQVIHSTYFEREYLTGVATDKLPLENYSRAGYAPKLAELLGQAAATSLIVGRALEEGTQPVFDDGDEVVQEGADALPCAILIGDHSGAFGEYKKPFENFIEHYARPVNIRAKYVPNPVQFAEIYLTAFREQFLHVQGDYRKRRRSFDTLFKHLNYDTGGSFAYRWECVLKRLDQADADLVTGSIREKIWVLRNARLQTPYPKEIPTSNVPQAEKTQ